MIRKLKLLGLALVAVLAMTAMVASAASAAAFTSSANTTNLTASQETKHNLRVTNGEWSCGSLEFTGHMASNTVTEVEITPKYTECHTFFAAVTVAAKVTGFGHYEGEAKSCAYKVDADGTIDLVCAAGKEVTIDAATCIVHIPPQNNLGIVTYQDLGNNLKATINITGITTNHTKGFGCLLTSGGHASTGSLTGSSLVSGKDAGGAAVNLGLE